MLLKKRWLIALAIGLLCACGGSEDSSKSGSGERGKGSDSTREADDDDRGWQDFGRKDLDDPDEEKTDSDQGPELAAHFYPGCNDDAYGKKQKVYQLNLATIERTCKDMWSIEDHLIQITISDDDGFAPKSGRTYRIIPREDVDKERIYGDDGEATAAAFDKNGDGMPVHHGTLTIDSWTDESDITGSYLVILDDDDETEIQGKFRADTCDDGTACLN